MRKTKILDGRLPKSELRVWDESSGIFNLKVEGMLSAAKARERDKRRLTLAAFAN
jgi:hypothetical protein